MEKIVQCVTPPVHLHSSHVGGAARHFCSQRWEWLSPFPLVAAELGLSASAH